jgi:hypothetical protein
MKLSTVIHREARNTNYQNMILPSSCRVLMYVYSRGGPHTALAPRPSLIYCALQCA